MAELTLRWVDQGEVYGNSMGIRALRGKGDVVGGNRTTLIVRRAAVCLRASRERLRLK